MQLYMVSKPGDLRVNKDLVRLVRLTEDEVEVVEVAKDELGGRWLVNREAGY